ncbi:MAG: hypothetical protein NXI32_22150, partial [bacterium]|nr:hypothetical protein [bacterium]
VPGIKSEVEPEMVSVPKDQLAELRAILLKADEKVVTFRKDRMEMANAVIAQYEDAVKKVAEKLRHASLGDPW